MSQNSDKVKRYRKRLQEFVREQKSRPCVDCGIQYPYYVMQFDHVRGKKEFGFNHILSNFVSKVRLLEELTKCEFVCANCHAQRTFERIAS